MEMKIVILISFTYGFIVGYLNDYANKNINAKLRTIDHIIVLPAIFFVIYIFFQSISFGLMSIWQILLGSYIGINCNKFFKYILKK